MIFPNTQTDLRQGALVNRRSLENGYTPKCSVHRICLMIISITVTAAAVIRKKTKALHVAVRGLDITDIYYSRLCTYSSVPFQRPE